MNRRLTSSAFIPGRGIVLLLIIFLASCNTVEPPPGEKPTLLLKLEDVSCTEAWIELTTTNLQLPATVTIKQTNPNGDTKSQMINLNTKDSLLYIDSLLPNQTYKFQASGIGNPVSGIQSNELSATTLDTTSHNFTWQTFTFGDIGNSVLFDVAIINESNIWAVGEIRIVDTSAIGYTTYNAVHWDGNGWELKRIKTNACGGVDYPPVKAIFAFSSTDILFAHIDGSISHYDGIEFTNDCSLITQLNGSANKMWGESNNNFYVVSGNGFIAHYNGSQWTRVESGTDVDLLDVWGSPDGTVWTCGYTNDYAITVLLRFDGYTWNKVYEGSGNNQNNNEYIGPTSGVWTNSKFFTYVASWGKIYRQPNNNILNIKRITPNFSDVAYSIRGTNHNNIFIAGQHGLVGHYNGATYKEITELKNQDEYLLKIDVKNNAAAAVGYNYQGFAGSTAVIHIINKN